MIVGRYRYMKLRPAGRSKMLSEKRTPPFRLLFNCRMPRKTIMKEVRTMSEVRADVPKVLGLHEEANLDSLLESSHGVPFAD